MRVHPFFSSARLLALAFLAAGSVGCPGDASRPPVADRGGPDRWIGDLPGSRSDWRPRPDQDLCTAFAKEGQSCAAQSCPAGLVPAVLDGTNCTCHVPCDPAAGKRCQPESCGRVCVQLTDASGTPLPGQGACVEDKGGSPGEPCPPACKLDLECVLHGNEVSFCRSRCTGPADCLGYKMVCVPLSSPTDQVCVPGGSTTGPKLGESCAAAGAFCVQGLLCDPQTNVCLRACSPSSGCTAPAACTKLVDPATNVTVGYGCR